MIKAIFFDIDHTIFDHKSNQVLPETIFALHKLREAGYKLALCSGRAFEMAKQTPVFDVFNWDGYIGGAGVKIYNEKYECISKHPFSKKQCENIFKLGEQFDICINPHGEFDFMTKTLDEYSKLTFEHFHLCIPPVKKWENEEICAISAFGDPNFDFSIFETDDIMVIKSIPTCADLMQKKYNKATGIMELMEYWNFPVHDFMAFGDSMNDLDMIKAAKISVAMGNSEEAIKQNATYTIGPCDKPSIYKFLLEQKMID